MFDQFVDAVAAASTWAYVALVVVAFLDALLPIVPSETSVITAGVVAADGHLSLTLVVATAAAGAFLGDNAGYLIGSKFGDRARRRLLAGESGQRRLAWATRQLAARGGELIVIGRFVPGGRTAVAVTSGLVHFRWRRFAQFDALAGVVWASYAALLGFFGGKAFEDAPWKGLLLAFGIATLLAGGGEVARRWRARGRARTGPPPLPKGPAPDDRGTAERGAVTRMRIVVAYESMYGSTHRVASAIAAGCPEDDVSVVPISHLDAAALTADVLVVGTPTHAHGLPSQLSRTTAAESAHTAYDDHAVEPTAVRPGAREWLAQLPASLHVRVATFDTRFRLPAWMSGHPAKAVNAELRRRGAVVLAEPASFFVDRHENLRAGEAERARRWGSMVRGRALAVQAPVRH